ncbi:hypothetical protein [Dokdonella soli]|uniref:hypothetical protein n=1 Tax=Dokdonella soli TaxID=529810 RepID=UPI0031E316C0
MARARADATLADMNQAEPTTRIERFTQHEWPLPLQRRQRIVFWSVAALVAEFEQANTWSKSDLSPKEAAG